MMVSTHFPMIYGHEESWVVVALILIVGGIIRDYFNRMNAGAEGRVLKWQWPSAALFMALLIVFISYDPRSLRLRGGIAPDVSEVLAITKARCSSCHASRPSDPDFDKAPAGVRLETIEDLRKYSDKIMKQAVLTRVMPLANRTKMTRAERDILGIWVRTGMPGDTME